MRFIATADWQLGMTAHYLGDEARPRFAQARIDAIRSIGRVAADRGAELVLVCGDVFESNQLDRVVVARAFDALREVTVPVWLLPGNHDPLDASSIYRSREFLEGCPEHVHVLDRPGVHVAGEGVEIVAAPWYSKAPLSDLVADALADVEPATDVVRIVAGHGTVLGIDRDDPAGISGPALEAAIAAGRAQFAVLGDRHSTTEVSGRIWYPGAPEVTSRREHDPGNVLVVDVDHQQVAVESVRVGTWTYAHHQAELTSESDVDELERWLAGLPAKDRTAVWLSLTGALTVGEKARLDTILDTSRDLFALIDLWERHSDLVVTPAEGEFGDLGLTGFARDAVEELTGRLAGDDAQAARDALGLLYRFSRDGAA
ncbi:metallophosphoesterase family protein [Aeromicrobium wangtongii]|uniref:metallophosphoesterase family protein n=1 Tax=Aeromicrobium wangtongii TaxID=2969247 RepID=UPI002016CD0E|nr:exonuclease SbcCD subunit D [Aeromicrobium wangtongii]MCL3819023.1 exonuclease SbcCD subunit D [Aeromicrobium wangtongii]